MSDLCERARRVLELYAEGELHDPASVKLVRAHLRGCEDCREALDLYDALTASLLAGDLEEERTAWTVLERERRVEGVLKRLRRAAPPGLPARGEERSLSGSRFDGSLDNAGEERATRGGRRHPPNLHIPGGIPPAFTRRTTRANRGVLVAAATLVGAVSVWLAFTPGRSRDRETLRHAPTVSSPAATPSGSGRHDPEPIRRAAGDRPLRWVVEGEGAHAPFQVAPAGPVRGRTLLYGVDYHDPGAPSGSSSGGSLKGGPSRGTAPPVDPASPPNEAKIEWVVEIVIGDTPWGAHGDALSAPRYFLLPESIPELVSEFSEIVRSGQALAAHGRWFRAAHVERRPRDGSSSRLRIGDSTVYRVCVYEGIRQVELPCPSWPRGRWDRTASFTQKPFGQEPFLRDHHRSVPPASLATFIGNWPPHPGSEY